MSSKTKKTEEDLMKGLMLKCDCGKVLTSHYSYYINGMDISFWKCSECGQTYNVSFNITEDGRSTLPEKRVPSDRKHIRLKCTACNSTIYSSKNSFINRLPKQSRWRCLECGTVFKVNCQVVKGISNEVR